MKKLENEGKKVRKITMEPKYLESWNQEDNRQEQKLEEPDTAL